ncbi:uncharacterized protein LOC129596549 [Paramacrobiotus metropolitanus]|uniref:uncharacterized protein LOC129596549 n=1 Tax=Paramacrobiotus metropolitanus TaxID=2943436 RepID=UPI002445AA32|nr:uncharacterized protein LOC129596549 [Paramacrobiotus metropolitanus]
MLIYGDATHPVWAWNAVDVLINNQLQHGDVINTAAGGLLIDFRTPTQRAEFVAFGSIFHCNTHTYWSPTEDDPVEVLLRRHPAAPWIWYPGTILSMGNYDPDDVQLVEVQLPHGGARELVPAEQVRPAPAEGEAEKRRVLAGDFVVRGCALPYWAKELGEGFPEEVQRRFQVRCTVVNDQTFSYLQRQKSVPLSVKRLDDSYEMPGPPNTRRGISRALLHEILHSMFDAPPTDPGTPDDPAVALPLPAVLLLEVLGALDSVGRFRCRRVSPLWNDLLTTEAHFPDVRVSANEVGKYGTVHFSEDGLYWMAAALLKCLNGRTKMAIITHVDLHRCTEITKLVTHILTGNRIPALVFYECGFGDEGDFIRDVVHRVAALVVQRAVCCERVVWRKCRLFDHNVKAAIAHYSFSVASIEQVKLQLWDLFEKNLVLRKPFNRAAVTRWIAECIRQKRIKDLDRKIVKALNYYQSPDPRASTPYRQWQWSLSIISELDATQLTTLTAAALSDGIDTHY